MNDGSPREARAQLIAELVAASRLAEAAAMLEADGRVRDAAPLFERNCDFAAAARCYERVGEAAHALSLWVLAQDTARATALLQRQNIAPDALGRLAFQFAARGDFAWAARLHQQLGQHRDAAIAWERAQEPGLAAENLERLGDVVGAARLLESSLRKAPENNALRIQLGRLLVRFGKFEPAVRTLQRVAKDSELRRDALALLVSALETLGLPSAQQEAQDELARMGGVDAAPPSQVGGTVAVRIFGRYALVREVAQTPTARVLECTDTVRQESVALKIFAGVESRGGGRDALARFEREVRVLASLDHPNIVGLRDFIDEGPAIAMEWMAGGTLEHLLAEGAVTPRRAIEIAGAVLSALAEAHRLGVVHRDVKPANVLFDAAGTAKLGDFGVAHLGDLSATATAAVVGTRGYMSPEQRMGHPATLRSDVYGVGALLLEMLTGTPPAAPGADVIKPSAAHRDLANAHDECVFALLAEDPNARPDGALAARSLLMNLRWPDVVQRIARARKVETAAQDEAERYRERDDGTLDDTWLHRVVIRVPVAGERLARARIFAKLAHPIFQPVLAVEAGESTLVLGAPPTPLKRALSHQETLEIERALRALHAEGLTHGALDQRSVGMSPSGGLRISLALDATDMGSADDDYVALSRLRNA